MKYRGGNTLIGEVEIGGVSQARNGDVIFGSNDDPYKTAVGVIEKLGVLNVGFVLLFPEKGENMDHTMMLTTLNNENVLNILDGMASSVREVMEEGK